MDQQSADCPAENQCEARVFDRVHTIRVLKFEERIVGYIMPQLRLACDGPLPQGFAFERDIGPGINGAIVAHEESNDLWCYQFLRLE